MKRTILANLAVILVLAMVSVALVAQHTPAQAGTSTLGYGAEANPTGNPIGGGSDYSNIITSGDYTVRTRERLLAALKSAQAGQVIYIEPTANIDMGGGPYGNLSLGAPSGVTIASNSGWDGSRGGA